MKRSIDYNKIYDAVETVDDWLQLLKDPTFDWTECMLSLAKYKPGHFSFEKIGEVKGDWEFNSQNLVIKSSENLENNKYVDASEVALLKANNFTHGYKEYQADDLSNRIALALGFTDYKAAINIQKPGSIKNLHADSLNGWYKDIEKFRYVPLDKSLKQPKGMKNLHRVFVALSDWQPGWMWQFGVDHWCNWKKGDVINFDWRNVPHCTANAGYSPRPILKITGISDYIDKNKGFKMHINTNGVE